jgi:hypothetical protein
MKVVKRKILAKYKIWSKIHPMKHFTNGGTPEQGSQEGPEASCDFQIYNLKLTYVSFIPYFRLLVFGILVTLVA